jgi:hypothetical protein
VWPKRILRRSRGSFENTRSEPHCAAAIHIEPRHIYKRLSLAAPAVPLDRLVAEGRLTEIPGIGEAIADIVTKLHRTGIHLSRIERSSASCWGLPALDWTPSTRSAVMLVDADEACGHRRNASGSMGPS